MCGFLAEFGIDNSNLISKRDFNYLLDLSRFRGPDSQEILDVGLCRMGFNRLAIMDLSSSANQPMKSPSGRYVIVFNGEIYNYQELEKVYELEGLKTGSDTERLTCLFDKLGVEATFPILDGMFAISVYDQERDQFYLARDFAGIKPLFYGLNSYGIVAASQFNQVHRHPWFQGNLKLQSAVMKEYFALGYMPAPNTIYESIFQVNPGELITFSRDGLITKQFFCTFNWMSSSYEQDVEENSIEKSLQAAVSNQLMSDVPLATFLSGGVDSPLITAMGANGKPELEAFTLGLKDSILDESKQAQLYAKELGIKHQVKYAESDSLKRAIESHFEGLTEPFGDYSSIPTFLITQEARKNYTVMLSGDGGDELFFGYPRMLDVLQKRGWFKIPYNIRKLLIRLTNKLGITKTWAPYNFKTLSDWVLSKHSYINTFWLDKLFGEQTYSKELMQLYAIPHRLKARNLLLWLRWNEFYGHMQRVLIKVDRMSMANSLEVRVPFLDKQVIKGAFKYVPKNFKSQKDLKHPLKDMMTNYFSKQRINQTKQGFAIPIEEWLKEDLKRDVQRVVLEKPIYGGNHINQKAVRDYVEEFYSNKHKAAWGVWHIYAWQKWAIKEGLVK